MHLLSNPSYLFGISTFLFPILFITSICVIFIIFNKKETIKKLNFLIFNFIYSINNQYLDHEELIPVLYGVFLMTLLYNFSGIIGFPVLLSSPIIVVLFFSLIFIIGIIYGIKIRGFIGFFTGMVPHGIPVFITPLIFILEIISLLVKPVVLCFRVILSIAVGHITLETFIKITSSSNKILPVILVPLLLLDIAKSFLYAFLITMFTASLLSKCTNKSH